MSAPPPSHSPPTHPLGMRGLMVIRRRPCMIMSTSLSLFLATVPTQGEEIRELKKSKADKATLQPHIDALIALKTQYKEEAGKAYVAPGAVAAGAKPKEPKSAKKAPAVHNAGKKGSAVAKGGDASRGLPPPPAAKGPVMENGKANLENLAQHLVAFSYVAGQWKWRGWWGWRWGWRCGRWWSWWWGVVVGHCCCR